ncbi:homoserine O-acetyltransferase [Rhodococcus sp. BP-252]|uniref:homoserine O-acetyltransferase MetX n=1 Tax=unclassified Rhodococcus (in: high G+C Gram-positive bacteria) TaxID=192944 RepID=UPI000DF2978F|nr:MULTISPECIES: homoserine O-acetyltransferase [unclassified Rhodococcus (in: high G+C Gram-positive bacteria)]MBY6413889.1 homoserine O-acetyltransferase [Rhodococcus sp. BP-320]MBY6419409.1 homoserine O-acetyltransferase [Rhodococcus sp. BP-321]MBY6424479.1 homoserine O-acetyltransferase [Rhodococcus sp. BP-324]MBY6428538.1 homoserine O-acetyltransferase [Rhodococcus sp. BP-323]MBY6434489.1 homoserine O-acetyltransferase [Rhodococcus sp. BP-322]
MTISSVHDALSAAGFPAADGRLGHVDIGDLELESGATLRGVTIGLQRWGTISPARDNVVLVEHALTGDSHVSGPPDDAHALAGWWDGMIGPGAPVDTDEWCVVATNVLGGCGGTTGPSSIAPDGKPYGSRFPEISIRDQVAAEAALADALGIERFAAVVGGSMGGMRTLEWIVEYPERVAAALVLAVGARATADQIGTQTTQIAAIMSDPDWQGGDYYGTGKAPLTGLGIARRIAHLTYRTESELDLRFSNSPQAEEDPWNGGRYAIESYLQHQATKLVGRFDAGTYVLLSEAMNRHDIGRGRGGVEAALARATVPTIVGGVDSDRLYPLRQQKEIARGLPNCSGLEVIQSRDGHDGFLTEAGAVAKLLGETMDQARQNRSADN